MLQLKDKFKKLITQAFRMWIQVFFIFFYSLK